GGGVVVVERRDALLGRAAEFVGVGVVAAVGPRAVVAVADRPAGDRFDVALEPPAVEHAQARHAVVRRLHAARAAGLERRARRVPPEIDAPRPALRPGPVVVWAVGEAQRGAPPRLPPPPSVGPLPTPPPPPLA